jgi:hypothetical protein
MGKCLFKWDLDGFEIQEEDILPQPQVPGNNFSGRTGKLFTQVLFSDTIKPESWGT